MTRIYALLTTQGTAAAETALCDTHLGLDDDAVSLARANGDASGDIAPNAIAGHPPEFTDCTDNDELACIWCGVFIGSDQR